MDIRTDLAVEAKESFEGDGGEIEGVTLKKKTVDLENGSFEVSRVCVLNEEGSRAMGKPIGNYISIDTPDIDRLSENDYERLANEVAHIIKKLVNCHCNLNKTYFRVFVAGLGNRCITADSLGPYVIDNIFITRHFVKEFGGSFLAKLNACEVCGIAPGVMAQTGMEALEIVKSIAGKVKPDVIVVIDALAARSIHRINRTIQITDTGINPGSGVGNHRMGLSEKELGIKVIGIGVPTVIEAGIIVRDRVSEVMGSFGLDVDEVNEFVNSSFSSMENMYVTTKDVDEAVERMGELIAKAVNIFTHNEQEK